MTTEDVLTKLATKIDAKVARRREAAEAEHRRGETVVESWRRSEADGLAEAAGMIRRQIRELKK